MEIMQAIASIPGIGPVLPYLTALIVVCAALATRLPPPSPTSGSFYAGVYGAVNFVGLNMGHAANATAPKQ